MTSSLEQRLRRSLRAGADSVEVPAAPDLRAAAEARAVRRHRRAGALAVLGSAALVAAIVLVPQLWERRAAEAPPATPSPTPGLAITFDNLPVGAEPRIPYLRDGVLDAPGLRDVAVEADAIVAAGDTVLVHRGDKWFRPGHSTSALLGVQGRPALSADGRTLVYATGLSGVDGTAVVAVDLTDGFARIGVRSAPASLRLLGVDVERRVLWVDGDRLMVWFPARDHAEQVAFGWEGDMAVGVGPHELLVAHDRSSVGASEDAGYVGPLVTEPDGTDSAVKKRLPVREPHAARFSPGGGYLFENPLWVSRLDDGTRLRFRLDGGLRPEFLAFESDQAALVHISKGGREGVARCSTRTGACELALEVPAGTDLVFPQG